METCCNILLRGLLPASYNAGQLLYSGDGDQRGYPPTQNYVPNTNLENLRNRENKDGGQGLLGINSLSLLSNQTVSNSMERSRK